jgi:hypothetical protein
MWRMNCSEKCRIRDNFGDHDNIQMHPTGIWCDGAGWFYLARDISEQNDEHSWFHKKAVPLDKYQLCRGWDVDR